MNTASQSQTIFVVGVTFPVKEITVPKREGSVKHVMPGDFLIFKVSKIIDFL